MVDGEKMKECFSAFMSRSTENDPRHSKSRPVAYFQIANERFRLTPAATFLNGLLARKRIRRPFHEVEQVVLGVAEEEHAAAAAGGFDGVGEFDAARFQ